MFLQLSETTLFESNAGGGIRTHEPLRDRVAGVELFLSPAPLTRLGNPRIASSSEDTNLSIKLVYYLPCI